MFIINCKKPYIHITKSLPCKTF